MGRSSDRAGLELPRRHRGGDHALSRRQHRSDHACDPALGDRLLLRAAGDIALEGAMAATAGLAGRCFALIIANDVATLPLARDLAGACRAKVIFDAHEFSPLEFEEDAKWRFFLESWTARLCCEHVPRVDGMMTVSEGIAERWQREYGVNPVVVPNAPPYHDMAVPERIGRPLRLVHHGVALRIRKIETLIDAALSWPDCELDLYLVANDRQLVEELRSRASGCSRIRILPPVPVERIVPTLGSYDVGVCAFTYQPAGFNTVQSLPNKFFDFIQARLAVCIGPLPEMAKWTTRYHLGVVARGFEAADLVDALKMLSDEDLLAMRRASAVAARDLCWEFFSSRLDALVDQVLGT